MSENLSATPSSTNVPENRAVSPPSALYARKTPLRVPNPRPNEVRQDEIDYRANLREKNAEIEKLKAEIRVQAEQLKAKDEKLKDEDEKHKTELHNEREKHKVELQSKDDKSESDKRVYEEAINGMKTLLGNNQSSHDSEMEEKKQEIERLRGESEAREKRQSANLDNLLNTCGDEKKTLAAENVNLEARAKDAEEALARHKDCYVAPYKQDHYEFQLKLARDNVSDAKRDCAEAEEREARLKEKVEEVERSRDAFKAAAEAKDETLAALRTLQQNQQQTNADLLEEKAAAKLDHNNALDDLKSAQADSKKWHDFYWQEVHARGEQLLKTDRKADELELCEARLADWEGFRDEVDNTLAERDKDLAERDGELEAMTRRAQEAEKKLVGVEKSKQTIHNTSAALLTKSWEKEQKAIKEKDAVIETNRTVLAANTEDIAANKEDIAAIKTQLDQGVRLDQEQMKALIAEVAAKRPRPEDEASSPAPSAKRQHLDTAPVSSSPAPYADDNTTFNLGDDDEIVGDDNSNNNNGLDDDNEAGDGEVVAAQDIDSLQAYDANGRVKRWNELSAAVQSEVRAFLSTQPGWLNRLLRSNTTHCLRQKGKAADHLRYGTTVACKTCASMHRLCISKVGGQVMLRPLCPVDRADLPANTTMADISFFRLPDSVRFSRSKMMVTEYGKVTQSLAK